MENSYMKSGPEPLNLKKRKADVLNDVKEIPVSKKTLAVISNDELLVFQAELATIDKINQNEQFLRLDKQEVAAVERHFSEHPEDIKLSKKSGLNHTYIKMKSTLFALANRKIYEPILGRGDEGLVKLAVTTTGLNAAVKIETSKNPLPLDSIEVMKKLGSYIDDVEIKYVPNLSEPHYTMYKHYTAMAYCEGKPLEYIAWELTSEQKVDVAIKCCELLAAYRSQNIVHGDIKPSHIYVKINESGQIMKVELIDFGASGIEKPSVTGIPKGCIRVRTMFGTQGYTAPYVEVKQDFLSYQSDIYSLGKVFEFLNMPPAIYTKMQLPKRDENQTIEPFIEQLKLYKERLSIDNNNCFKSNSEMSGLK